MLLSYCSLLLLRFLWLHFANFIRTCLGLHLLLLMFWGVLCASWIFLLRFGSFLPIFLQIIFCPSSLSFSPGNPLIWMLFNLVESLSTLNLFLLCIILFFFFFFNLIMLQYSVFYVISSSLRLFQPLVHSIKHVSHFVYQVFYLCYVFLISVLRISLLYPILFSILWVYLQTLF